MIMTDIYVAALNRTCDFKLNEDVPIALVIDEVLGILAKEVTDQEQPSGEGFTLCSAAQETKLPKDATLRSCGIVNGDRLILV